MGERGGFWLIITHVYYIPVRKTESVVNVQAGAGGSGGEDAGNVTLHSPSRSTVLQKISDPSTC